MEFKKNIVLTPVEANASQKAVLSYIKQNNNYFFEFKGINFIPKNRILGVYINNILYKYDLNGKTLSFELSLNDIIDNVSVVVLDRQNMLKPFLWGSQMITQNDYLLNKVIEEINIKTINENFSQEEPIKIEEESNSIPFEEIKREEPVNEEIISSFSFIDNLTNLDEKYAEALTREQTLEEEDKELEQLLDTYQDEIDNDIDKNEIKEEPEFYSLIASQVEKMLSSNESEKILEEIIPDSKFVQVPKSNGESYVFGIIYENNIPKYLCYGERGKFSEERPEHLKAYYQWLPIDVDDLSGEGYFMMYQDAKTGKNLEMTVI